MVNVYDEIWELYIKRSNIVYLLVFIMIMDAMKTCVSWREIGWEINRR